MTEVRFLNEHLKPCESIKLLGVHITKSLEWGLHVDKVAKRAGQHLGIIRKTKRLLSPAGLASLFKARVRSLMEYCGPIWQGAPKTTLNKLDCIQHKACKLMGKNQGTFPELNLQSLQHRRNISGLCKIYRMVSGIAPHSVCQLLPTYVLPTRNSRYVAKTHHLQLTISRSKTEHHMNSFVPSFSRFWNLLSNECIYDQRGNLNRLQDFKVSANRFMLSRTSIE